MKYFKHRKHREGFTLIELIIVILLLGVLAISAIPRFLNLADQAEIAATRAGLRAIRSALEMQYAENAAAGNAAFPSSLDASDFEGGLPTNQVTGNTGVGTVVAAPGGTATHATNGFWYIVANGNSGAYSDGTVDTGSW